MGIFIIWIVLSIFAGMIGSDKSVGFWGGFFISLILSPIVGFLVVIFSGEKPARVEQMPPLSTGIADEIAKFKKLMDDGVISQHDYELQRDKLLGK